MSDVKSKSYIAANTQTCLLAWNSTGAGGKIPVSDIIGLAQIPDVSGFLTQAEIEALPVALHDHAEFLTQAEIESLIPPGGGGSPSVFLADVKASGTPGGSSLAQTWQVRDIGLLKNTIPGCSLVSNQLTLPPGDYEPLIFVPGYNGVSSFMACLYNVSTSTLVSTGSTGITYGAYVLAHSVISEPFSLEVESLLEVRMWSLYAYANFALGYPHGGGIPEVYTHGSIRKV